MKKKTSKFQAPWFFTKKTIAIIFCISVLAFFVTSCYTSQKCPAYGYTSQVTGDQGLKD
jgi:hypothetical protein